MQQYHEFLEYILNNGDDTDDRTGVGTRRIFNYQMDFDLENQFPLVTTKKCHFKSIVAELLWFLRGDTNTKYLKENGVKIWDEWADENGNLGPVYGHQWRNWENHAGKQIDQISNLINGLKKNPSSRRHIVSAWNVGQLEEMALPPCHAFFQFFCSNGKLSCKLTQRSADAFLGVPFNIASYSLLTYIIAHECGLKPHRFIWSGGDCHIYQNHFDQVKIQLTREPFPLPQIEIDYQPIEQYELEHFKLINYQSHPGIKAPIAV
tara:strand:+ start:3004 stop:3792 length:789 start_codon:yes stop_codon:yes gene_type:complete